MNSHISQHKLLQWHGVSKSTLHEYKGHNSLNCNLIILIFSNKIKCQPIKIPCKVSSQFLNICDIPCYPADVDGSN